jgi:membrane protein HdeD
MTGPGRLRPRPRRRRTTFDALGLVLLVTGLLVLGDVAWASRMTVLFVGWTLIVGGALGIALTLVRVRVDRFWVTASSPAVGLVAGFLLVRKPSLSVLTLSVAIGALLVLVGTVRAISALKVPDRQPADVASGVLALVLGLMVFNRWPTTSQWFLATLLGLQLVVDGFLILAAGRLRTFVPAAAARSPSPSEDAAPGGRP